MSPSYRVTEPHPHVSTSYMHTGRGGAGNKVSTATRNARSGSPPANVLSPEAHLHSSSSRFTTGRGGAGNAHSAAEQRAIFSFDEEIDRQRAAVEHAAPVVHVGRGGAGNIAHSIRGSVDSEGRPSYDSAFSGFASSKHARHSEDSAGGHNAWKRLSRTLSRGS
ncbi:MAG: hypothetical protein M1825_002427 [Sarcosagium campestre]|nr:MAG: hypothetical protein M1825_002427 [Sarcosagium campestre]